MSTLLAEPLVEEVPVASPAIPKLVVRQAEAKLPVAEIIEKEEMHPLWAVFIACAIAFQVAAAMIGTMVAWIYQLRHSGAFAP